MNSDNQNIFDIIKKLQHVPPNIRNVCVIAHVDHGNYHLIKARHP